MNPQARTKARRLAVQALYQWYMTANEPHEVEAHLLTTQDVKKIDVDYFHELVQGVTATAQELDAKFTPVLDRPFEQLDPIELSVLRLGTYELLNQLEVPYRVVINESVELAKMFGASDSFKYINSLLDKVAAETRPHG